ncbi:MAG TPA: aldo/keto reductase [Candidatus Hydrogenedentes bacterium]|nr:aldo/keto reductase [Candidatus Hydrogenedentota bacterium]
MSSGSIRRREFIKGAMLTGAGLQLAEAGAQGQPASSPPSGPMLTPPPDQKIPRRKLGKTGVDTPILIMGCCQTLDAAYDKRLHRAYAIGVDHLDTAQMYAEGQSHKTLAPFIKQVGDRKKLFIGSKVFQKGEEGTPEAFKTNIDLCLKDLETDYMDAFYMHIVQHPRLLDPEFVKMGEELKKAGKIRFFGFSCHHGDSIPTLMNKAAAVGGFDVIMFRYSFRECGDLELNKAIDACHKAGIGLIAIKTLASVPDDQEQVKQFQSKNFTLIQAKLKAVWADERIAGIASQMGNVQHVMENAAAAISPTQLSMEEFMQLHRFAGQSAHQHCKGCSGVCESCVEGPLRIADTLRYLMYAECYEQRDMARALYAELSEEERRFDLADLSAAQNACPQGIDIAARLAHAHSILSA